VISLSFKTRITSSTICSAGFKVVVSTLKTPLIDLSLSFVGVFDFHGSAGRVSCRLSRRFPCGVVDAALVAAAAAAAAAVMAEAAALVGDVLPAGATNVVVVNFSGFLNMLSRLFLLFGVGLAPTNSADWLRGAGVADGVGVVVLRPGGIATCVMVCARPRRVMMDGDASPGLLVLEEKRLPVLTPFAGLKRAVT